MTTNLVRNRATLEIVFAVATGLSLSSPDYLHGFGTGIVADQSTRHASHPVEKRSVRPGICEREAEKLLGQKPLRIDRSVRAPKKVRDVPPKYPELPPGTIGSGMWIGEVLISDSGKIAHVWRIREVDFTPPFPAFNSAITDAIQQWEFEQLFIQGAPVPVCMTVTVNINWK